MLDILDVVLLLAFRTGLCLLVWGAAFAAWNIALHIAKTLKALQLYFTSRRCK